MRAIAPKMYQPTAGSPVHELAVLTASAIPASPPAMMCVENATGTFSTFDMAQNGQLWGVPGGGKMSCSSEGRGLMVICIFANNCVGVYIRTVGS